MSASPQHHQEEHFLEEESSPQQGPLLPEHCLEEDAGTTTLSYGGRTNRSTAGRTFGTTSPTANRLGKGRRSRSVWYGRLVFVVCLVGAAAALGALAYWILRRSEESRAETRFESIAERALRMAQLVLEERKLTTDSLAHVAAAAHPLASAWPNVYIPGFEEIATSLRLVTEGQGVSFCPLITQPGTQQQWDFEAFAYNLFEERGFPNHTGISAFGKGIFNFGSVDPVTNQSWPDSRYHAVTNRTYWGNPNDILVPFIQNDLGYHTVLMLNINYEHTRGELIADILKCGMEREIMGDFRECGGLSNLMWSPTNHDVDPGPAGMIMVPIYPEKDNTTITGFIVTKTIFHDLLRHGFTEDVDGIYAVLRTPTLAHSYMINGGIAHYEGQVDLKVPEDGEEVHEHEPMHNENESHNYMTPHKSRYAASAHINPRYFGTFTVPYYLDLYSTQEYEESFHTHNPWIACIGAVVIILCTSLLFFGYDFFVKKEFDSHQNLLQAKRQFVRFVSHEVRTPLNTVCMGLTLLQHDFVSQLRVLQQQQQQSHEERQHAESSPSSEMSSTGDKDSLEQPKPQHDTSGPVMSSDGNSSHKQSPSNALQPQEQLLEEWVSLAQQIHQNADTAVGVLNDLLNYDKIQMGTLTLEFSLLSPWTVVERVVHEFKIAAWEKKVKLELDWSPLILSKKDAMVQGMQAIMQGLEISTASGHLEKEQQGQEETPADEENTKNTKDEADFVDPEQAMAPKRMSKSSCSKIRSSSQLPSHLRHYCKIVADHIRIAQVIRNLISNGLKFTKENGHLIVRVLEKPCRRGKVRVMEEFTLENGEEIKLLRRGDVLVQVIDDGVGMTQEQVRNVFKDGTQYNSNKLQAGGGSGLGLNIAKGIAVEHRGQLTCNSEGIGKGATFTLSLPHYEEQKVVVDPSKNDKVGKQKQIPGNPMGNSRSTQSETEECEDSCEIPQFRILVVDDSATNRKLCMRLLSRHGHICDGAMDGQEGVDRALEAMDQGHPYDCILLDYEMPRMNGPSACQAMRERGCDSYIVGVTGNVMSEDVAHFRSCGANWVLPKPFQLEALEQRWVESGLTPHNTPNDIHKTVHEH